MSKTRITLGVQSGDVESSDATRPAFMKLRKELESHCTKSYSPVIEEFAIVLRISGSIWQFEGEGLQKLRLSRKNGYVTVDFVVPEYRWKGATSKNFKKYLSLGVEDAVKLMVDKLHKSEIVVDSKNLFLDVNNATASFLAK